MVSACGGGDDDSESDDEAATATTTPALAATTTTVAATTTTAAPTTTTLPPLVLVTDGATIVVANASGVDGAAGRMTNALEVVGFTAADATNSSEGPLATTKVYYDPDVAEAQAVAESLREALGGGDIEVLELTVPAPLTDPDSIGDASVLLAMGNDTADKSLDELQGRVPPAEETADDDSDDDTSDDADDDATEDDDTDATEDDGTDDTGDDDAGETDDESSDG